MHAAVGHTHVCRNSHDLISVLLVAASLPARFHFRFLASLLFLGELSCKEEIRFNRGGELSGDPWPKFASSKTEGDSSTTSCFFSSREDKLIVVNIKAQTLELKCSKSTFQIFPLDHFRDNVPVSCL